MKTCTKFPVKYLSGVFFLCFLSLANANDSLFSNKEYSNSTINFAVDDHRSTQVAYDIMQISNDQAVVEGELKRFHKLTFTWDAGVNFTEEDNTFKDYRLNVTFLSPTGKSYRVPGYFAADGDAGESSATSGSKWRCHFTALETGNWTYTASFRSGTNIAVSFDETEGSAVAPIDGDAGSFSISETDKFGKDFRSKGKLEYVGEHFMQWTNGEYFMKMGSNSPETFLEYDGFDDTNSTRSYPSHIADWNSGDPIWKDDRGKGIIGAVNYLGGKGINSQFFVLHRDFGTATPWSEPAASHYSYDVSKMDQWQIVFDHMMEQGLMAHFGFSESTNQSFFEVNEPSEDPMFSNARKIYFREIIARFGYLNAVTWNIGEENGWDRQDVDGVGLKGRGLTTMQQLEFMSYIDSLAYYNDFITVHNGHASTTRIYDGLLGDNSVTGTSMQGILNNILRSKGSTERYLAESSASGKKWVIYYDEAWYWDALGNPNFRTKMLWPTLTSGGAGIELYTPLGMDLSLQDYRLFDEFYSQMKYALDLYQKNNIPFHSMYNQDDLVTNGWCHGDDFNNYVIYVDEGNAGTTTIDLLGDYEVKWYDPRNGGDLQNGTITNVSAGELINLGLPPYDIEKDWIVVVRTDFATGPIPVNGIIIDPVQMELGEGSSFNLRAQVLPGNADERGVIWSSDDPAIVTVDSEGNIIGVGIGTTKVSAITLEGGFVAQSTITVVDSTNFCNASGTILMERYDNITGVLISDLLSAPNYPDNPTSILELTKFEIPTNAGNNYGVRVSGYICAPQSGNYTFWIAGDDHCQLNLSTDSQVENVRTIAFHNSYTAPREWDKYGTQRSEQIWLQEGQTYYIEALLKDAVGGDNLAVGWRKPSDRRGGSPSEIIPGNVLSTSSMAVSVSGVTLNPSEANIIVGETLQLDGQVFPSNATNTTVVWSSGDISLVTVDAQGLIQGVAVGSTNVRVTSVDGSFVAETTVTVSQSTIPVTGVAMIETEVAINVGELQQLAVEVQPADATDQSVVWSSQDSSVVTVDSDGNIVGISGGVTTVTAVTVDGNFVTEATVTVSDVQTPVASVTLNIDNANILVGEQLQLFVQVLPSNATDPSVIWSTGDPSTVTVDSEGNILGIAVGTAQVSVTTVDGNFVAEATITVSDAQTPVTGVTLNIDDVSILVGEQLQLAAQVQPSNATDLSVIWSTEDSSVVTIDSEGNIFGIAVGTTQVSVTTVDGNFVAVATVTVTEPIMVSGIIVSPTAIRIAVGENLQVMAEVQPADATDQSVTWSSEDTTLVSVTSDGNITGLAVGTTTISATTIDGQFVAQATVEVVDSSLVNVTDIILDFDSIDVQVGESIDLNPTILPEDASDNSVIWSSNDTSIVTVSPQGTITGMVIGTTTVVVTTTDGGYSAELSVTVIAKEVLMVYPNPAVDYITISGVNELIFVSIFTSNGQLLNRVKTVPGGTEIYVADLPRGIYFIGLDNGRKLPFLKF